MLRIYFKYFSYTFFFHKFFISCSAPKFFEFSFASVSPIPSKKFPENPMKIETKFVDSNFHKKYETIEYPLSNPSPMIRNTLLLKPIKMLLRHVFGFSFLEFCYCSCSCCCCCPLQLVCPVCQSKEFPSRAREVNPKIYSKYQ